MGFIFQSVPERYDIRKKLKEGAKASWIASRYRNKMKKGEVVYLWIAGDIARRGLYGWGEISSRSPKLYASKGYRINVEYKRNFLDHDPPKHISSEIIRKDPILQNHRIFLIPVGTNFILNYKEELALWNIINQELEEEWLPPKPLPLGEK